MRISSWAANQHITMIFEGLGYTETSLSKQQQIYKRF